MGSPESRQPNDLDTTGKSRAARVYSRARGFITRRQPSYEPAQAHIELPSTRNVSPDIPQDKIQKKARTVAARQKEGLTRTPHAIAVREAIAADHRRAKDPITQDKRISLAIIDYMREVNDTFVTQEMTEFINSIRSNFTSIRRDALKIYAFIQPDTTLDNKRRKYVYSFALVPTAENEEDVLSAAQTANEVTRAYLGSKYMKYDEKEVGDHEFYYAETTFKDAGPSHDKSPLAIENCYHVIPSGNGRMLEISIAKISNTAFTSAIGESVLINRVEPFIPLFPVK